MAVSKQTALSEPLTERELEILALLVEGRSNSEIAKSLVIALETVKWYNRRIFEKLSVSNRTEAAARANELGLLRTDEAQSATMPVAVHHNLPSATTPFIGREAEITELTKLISDNATRLITILAPGGMGKTRLALETARQFVIGQQSCLFPNGIFFITFASVQTAQQIVSTIAEQIGIQFYGTESPRQQLLEYFREKRVLLLFDNFEHLLEGIDFIRDLLQVAPKVQLIIMSREKLNLRDEAVYVLRGLEFAEWDTREAALASSSVQLFVQHARLARTDFMLQADDLPYLARICRLVQAMPLGLILAAAWVEMLSLREIADEIALNLDFLESQSRDIPDSQRSIRAVFDHAWKRLSSEEQDAFMKLAVFHGGFTRRAAQSITRASLRTLQTLVSKALITRVSDERFEIHELLRQYAEIELEQSSEVDTTRDAHSRYYLNAVSEREADIKGRRQTEALTEIETDFENVRTAWHYAVQTRQIARINHTLEAISWFCGLTRNWLEGRDLFQFAVDALSPASDAESLPVWSKLALRWLRIDRWRMGSYQYHPDAENLIRKCLILAQHEEDELEIAHCLYALADYAEKSLDIATALDYYDQCTVIYEQRSDWFHVAWAIHFRSYCFVLSQPDEAARLQMKTLELRQRIGDKVGASSSWGNLCEMAWTQGKIKEAEYYLAQAASATPIFTGMLYWHNVYAAVFPLLRGDFARANQLAQESLHISESRNYFLSLYLSLAIIGMITILREDYTTGRQMCERCLRITSKPSIPVLASVGLALAACGCSDMREACTHVTLLLQTEDESIRTFYVFMTPIAAVITYYNGQLEQAAELVGAAYHLYPEVTWYEQWALFSRLRSDLRAKLGDSSYKNALKRGEQITIEQIIHELKTTIAQKHTAE